VLAVYVANLNDIIAAKRWSNRLKDQDDLIELQQLAARMHRDRSPDLDL